MMPEDQCPWCLNHTWNCNCEDEDTDEDICSDCFESLDHCECDL